MSCVILRREKDGYEGKQGGIFTEGVSAESVGAKGLCMHVLHIPPNSQGEPHLHAGHESAIYVISGSHEIWHGDDLSHHDVLNPGDMVYVPANMPHMPVTGDEPVTVVVARTDPREQESVHLLRPRDEERGAERGGERGGERGPERGQVP